MSKPTILTLAYLGIAAIWQYFLWRVWPNVGMGGLGIIYIAWPLLLFSGLVLLVLFKRYLAKSVIIFTLATTAMLLGTYSIHPNV